MRVVWIVNESSICKCYIPNGESITVRKIKSICNNERLVIIIYNDYYSNNRVKFQIYNSNYTCVGNNAICLQNKLDSIPPWRISDASDNYTVSVISFKSFLSEEYRISINYHQILSLTFRMTLIGVIFNIQYLFACQLKSLKERHLKTFQINSRLAHYHRCPAFLINAD